jgi:predicted DsbA family dithiol-disulfide isomerase
MSPLLQITEFTDPGCPFAWSAEPARRRLQWLYGDQVHWDLQMVGLAERPEEYEQRGFTPEKQSASFRRLAGEYHMPIDTRQRPRMAATLPACRAVVAARRRCPGRERALLRSLRVLHFSGRLLDDPETLRAAAERTGIDATELQAWMAEPETEAALQEDLSRARQPHPRALALSHKLAETHDGRRYTCPSLEIVRCSDGTRLAVPGFQPLAAYEVVIANLCPKAERSADPEQVDEVLRWAAEPLATAEVAAVCDLDLLEAREQLGRVAEEEHVGADGLWHLNGALAPA